MNLCKDYRKNVRLNLFGERDSYRLFGTRLGTLITILGICIIIGNAVLLIVQVKNYEKDHIDQ